MNFISNAILWSAVACVCILIIILGWFLPPLLSQNHFGIFVFMFVSFFFPACYFFLKYLYKQESTLIIICCAILILTISIFPFSLSYHHLQSDWYLLATIPFLLNFSVSIDLISEKKIVSVRDLNGLILEYFPLLPVSNGILLLFQTITNNTNPPFTELSDERKYFLIFKIVYFFAITIIFFSIKSKYKKQGKKTLPELLLALFLISAYAFISIYLFLYKDYLGGHYQSYAIEFTKFLGITTILSISIILYEKQTTYAKSTRKIYMFSLVIYFSMIFLPLILNALEVFMPFLSNVILNKPESFISIVASSILASLITSILLKVTVERSKKAQLETTTNQNKLPSEL